MTQEEKQLLLKDICARLPYKAKVYGNYRYSNGDEIVDDKKIKVLDLSAIDWFVHGIEVKPYLRPLSSMTEEEAITIFKIIYGDDTEFSSVEVSDNCIEIWDYDYNEDGFSERTVCTIYFEEIVRSMEVLDYLLSRHFDIPHWIESEKTYKTMIEMCLALEAPEGMYN